MSEDRNSTKETGSEKPEDGKPETSTVIETNQEADAKPGESSNATETSAAEHVFDAGDKEEGMFKDLPSAEKTVKSQQRYISELQKEIKEKDEKLKGINPIPAPNPASEANPMPQPSPGLEKEVAKLKNQLIINRAFDSFASENPDFKGKVRDVTAEIIEAHTNNGESIVLKDAFAMAKAKLGVYESQNSEKTRAAAGFSGGRPGGASFSSSGKALNVSERDMNMLRGLGLKPDAIQRVVERAAEE